MHKQHSISETPLYDSGKAFIANQVNKLGFQTHLSLIKIKKKCDAHQDQLHYHMKVCNITQSSTWDPSIILKKTSSAQS